MTLQIIDNAIPQDRFRVLSDVVLSMDFPWYFNTGKVTLDELDKDNNSFQFTHTFYKDYEWISSYKRILDPILTIINPFAIFRIKANLNTITPTNVQSTYHVDVDNTSGSKLKSACFYVNTNNGYTVFKSGKTVSSVANRLIIFDSDNYHAGVTSTDTARRVVINFVYFPVHPEPILQLGI